VGHGVVLQNATNGKVMYSSGHDHQGGGTVDHQIAAQRSFHNFMLLAGKERALIQTSNIDAIMTGLNWYVFSVTTAGGYPPYSYNWTSSIGGTFTKPDSASTAFVPPNLSTPTQGIITCTVTDSCSRVMSVTQVFTLTPSPLPVTLTEFTAKPEGINKVVANWKTESEINNKYFEVARSKNGYNYSLIGSVPSKGSGSNIREYELTDFNPYNGVSYYRLSQTDYNGKIEHFNPVIVNRGINKTDLEMELFPNPFTDHIKINYESDHQGNVTVSLITVLGKVLKTHSMNIDKGMNEIIITDLEDCPKGNYLLNFVDNTKTSHVFKLIK